MSTAKDPVRLLSDPSVPESQRALLRHGTGLEPPPGAEERVWQALAGVIGAASIGGAAEASTKTTTAATKVKAGMTGAKLAAVVAALGALGALVALGGLFVPKSLPRSPIPAAPTSAAKAPAPAPALPRSPQPAGAEASPWDEVRSPAEAKPSRPATGARKSVHDRPRPAAAASATPSSDRRVEEEAALIKEARQTLRGGDTARALRILDDCARFFRSGALEQEREQLAIEALAWSGQRAEAAARAAAFMRKFPDSPHAGEIRALGLGAPAKRLNR